MADPTSTSSEAPPGVVGLVIDGRYKILDLLGVGGMGAVYIAEHLTLKKQVALKVILAEFAGNEEIAARFTREAMATAQIEHPNVASALDYGTLPDGGAYLVTQLVRGHSLSHERDNVGKMPWKTVAHVGAQIADALSAAHAIHVVHRDLKPDNILLEPRDNGLFLVKVLDFGVARVTETAALPKSELTRMGTVIGTPGYMAPEQAMGEQVSEKVDLYALGVIMWECLTGRTLWTGDTISDMFTNQLSKVPPPISKEVPEVPPELTAMIEMLLDRNPKRRPESARHVREALRRLTHGTIAVGQQAPVIVRPAASSPKWIVPALAGFGILVLAAVLVSQLSGGDAGKPSNAPGDVPAAAKTEPAPGTTAALEVPAALAGHVQTLLTSADKKARKSAADAVAEFKPAAEVPLFARNIATLERQTTCPGKLAVVEKISADGDPRALPALDLLSKTPRKGCEEGDCLGCLRETLARTIGELSK
ncbi:MAG: serine/threonine protein kinase [Myxococcales bacterium]|nr:serine/threonine protein kinase [Myxococcales bacterium]